MQPVYEEYRASNLYAPAPGSEWTLADLQSWIEELPCLAFLERNGWVVAQNARAAASRGLDLGSTGGVMPVKTQGVLLGAFPFVAEIGGLQDARPQALTPRAVSGMLPGDTAQSFDCLLICRSGQPMAIHGSVKRLGTSDMRLVVAFAGASADRREPPEGSFLSALLDAAPEAMALTYEGRLLHVNREFCRLFGFPREDSIGQDLQKLLQPEPHSFGEQQSYRGMDASGAASIETRRRTREGEWIDVSILVGAVQLGGRAQGLFYTFRDIRPQKELEARLQHWALHDALTDLPNRTLFLDRMGQCQARLQRDPSQRFAILFMDLDGFKHVNDTFGHGAGDALLFEVAERLRECVRPQDTIARFGGDEFALLLQDTANITTARVVAERLQWAVRRPVQVEEGVAQVSASIGIALIEDPKLTAEQALHLADIAMYNTKAAGKARYQVFVPSMGLPRAS